MLAPIIKLRQPLLFGGRDDVICFPMIVSA